MIIRTPKAIGLWAILFCASCNSGRNAPVPLPEVKKPMPVLKEVLETEKFGHSSGLHTLTVTFDRRGNFEFNYGSEGWYWTNSGKYSYSDTAIDLKSYSCGFWQEKDTGCKNSFSSGRCFISEMQEDIEYQYELVCGFNRKFRMFTSDSKTLDQMKLDIKRYKLPLGTLRKYKGHQILTTGNAIGTVKETVFLREGPGTEFKRLQYIVNAYDGPRFESVPAGNKVTVHGRTVTKFKVKDWENFWLLISIDDSHKAWAFGEFIEY